MAHAVDLTLDLPPILTSHPVVPPMMPMAAAEAALAEDSVGAGDLFWSCATDSVSVAFVLEPEVSPERAQEMLFALMVAAGDAIARLSPELALPGNAEPVLANRAGVGSAHIKVSSELDDDGAPMWLIAGLDLALKPKSALEPGETPDQTSLWDEGAADLEGADVIAALSRHFLTWINRWDGEGFKPVHDAWLFRCEGRGKTITLSFGTEDEQVITEGQFLGLDEIGNLLMRTDTGTQVFAVTDHMESIVHSVTEYEPEPASQES
ncbi:conserved hypothetical protein [Roseibium sp. TrichSKD4]|uniref:biotin/lipoate--protein ligase family protein n=1 Tax=Roseibium sp. TrichSKD4 TaxID=744980 RepID=UPI0001E57000|nr:biotin/lipoate--protein ligase family protein [Roseibium sp. TrichSKD4]EFO30415.1 conserved hypothetical protein [Roseibium sp. TrichSKD4]